MGKIHSFDTFGAVDGPGIRFVLFMQGCPMRCKYCHNPDSWSLEYGKEMSVEELMVQIRKYKHYYSKTGGVTVSGGEPMVQIDFITELFEALKKEGINTCIDTSGILFNTSPEMDKKIEKLMTVTDLVLLDIKHINSEKHKELTGHGNENVLAYAKYLNDIKQKTWIRHVLVPTITTDEDYLAELRAFLDTLNNIEKIEILPYHTMGKSKYQKLNIPYPLEDIEAPTQEQVDIANKILKEEKKNEKRVVWI